MNVPPVDLNALRMAVEAQLGNLVLRVLEQDLRIKTLESALEEAAKKLAEQTAPPA